MEEKKTVKALFHLFPCRKEIFCHPSPTLGLGPLGLRLYSEAITPSNFTYVLLFYNGEGTEKKWHDGHNLQFSMYANLVDEQGQ